MTRNPFGVLSPERVDASYIADNFVDVFTDLPRIKDPFNTFISGARGSGKSMLLRSLEPEVLLRKGQIAHITELDYFSVHVPLKQAEFGVTELKRSSDAFQQVVVGEHLLTMQVTFHLLKALARIGNELGSEDVSLFLERFLRLYNLNGGDAPTSISAEKSGNPGVFEGLASFCEAEIVRTRQHYKRRAPHGKPDVYDGPLTGFLEFLAPLSSIVASFTSLGGDTPVYLMLDDADNLPRHLQKIVNTWVSARTAPIVCFKVTTQLGYATYRTLDNRIIESPHDYIAVDLSAIYTSENNSYFDRVREIVNRRFSLAGIEATADEFFPRDEAQAVRLEEIRKEIAIEHKKRAAIPQGRKGPTRSSDEILRTAVPRLMRELAGSSRSSHTFSYSGFRSLVDLSSGIIRWFLEPASRMYDRVVSENGQPVEAVPVRIQDKVAFEWAQEFIQKLSAVPVNEPVDVDQVDDDTTNASLHAIGHETDMYERLLNVLDALGMLFRHRLLDDQASEQRVFSIVLRGKPGVELHGVLEMGVRLGYFQKADNAPKETVGRRLPRYIMARRLAPWYRLDVSGYAAHISVLAADLEVAMRNPNEFVQRRLKQPDPDAEQLALQLDAEDD